MSETFYYASGRKLAERGALALDAKQARSLSDMQLKQLGIAMDTALTGPAQSGGAVQMSMLETMLPGVVRVSTAVRLIDEIAGVRRVGRWEDERIGLRVATPVAKAELYGQFLACAKPDNSATETAWSDVADRPADTAFRPPHHQR